MDIAAGLLRRHERWRPGAGELEPSQRRADGVSRISASGGELRQSPVHDVDLAEVTHHDVVRFEVTVHDPLERWRTRAASQTRTSNSMNSARCGTATTRASEASAWRSVFAVPLTERSAKPVTESLPFDHLHREVGPAIRMDAHLVHGRDTGVVELRRDLRLA